MNLVALLPAAPAGVQVAVVAVTAPAPSKRDPGEAYQIRQRQIKKEFKVEWS